MKVSDYVINRLADEGIKKAFVVYGGASAGLMDAFTRTDKMSYVVCSHEQIAGFAAEGYAKIVGLGTVIVTSGPGAQNLQTSISNCFYDSTPVVFLTGQCPALFMSCNDKVRQIGFQEARICEGVNKITKYSKMITDPNEIKYELEKAIYLAKSGRPGPVLLDIPADVQEKEIDLEKLSSYSSRQDQIQFDNEDIDLKIKEFLKDLQNAKRPVVIVGNGIRLGKAIDELTAFTQKFRIPLFPTWNAIDCVTDDNEYFGGRIGVCGGKGRNYGIQNSDLLLSIGSRLSLRLLGGGIKYFARGAKKYAVEIDPNSMPSLEETIKGIEGNNAFPIDVKIHADVKYFLRRLLMLSQGDSFPDFSEWNNWVFERRDKYDPSGKEVFDKNSNGGNTHPYAFMRLLSNQVGNGGVITADAGGNVTVFCQSFETKKGQRTFSSNGNSPMGFSVAGAIGAWFACENDPEVIAIIGDGGFGLNPQVLQTMRKYNVGVKVFVLDNHCLGFTKQFQTAKYKKMEACDETKGYYWLDPLRIAAAHDIPSFRISGNNEKEISDSISNVLDTNGPVVCDVDCGDFISYAPRILGRDPIEDMTPKLPWEEHISNMIIEPIKRG